MECISFLFKSTTMKFFTIVAFWTILSSSVEAFAPSAYQCHTATCVPKTQLCATPATPASSRDEDLILTRQVIMDHADRSSTASKEQFIQQTEELKKEHAIETIDVSIPYMATAKLAFEQSDKSVSYDEFEVKYLADSVLDIIAKQPIDVSIPYMATSQLAFEQSDKSMSYKDFEVKYLANSVLDVIAKQPVDVSIPYMATTQLAFGQSDKS